jgi:hypothetical protein
MKALTMKLDILKSAEIIEIMENYLEGARPVPEIRKKLDIGYSIENTSVFLFEIRPKWNNPELILTLNYAKASFVKSKNYWKVYWLRSNQKWSAYDPSPIVYKLSDFLTLVDEDKYHCFKG